MIPERIVMQGVDFVVTRPVKPVSIETLKRYRREHGCTLGEACRALGWQGTRMYFDRSGGPR